MKVGLSFSRCIKDIFLGEVDYEEVLIIIASTNFNPNDDISWEDIQRGLSTFKKGGHQASTTNVRKSGPQNSRSILAKRAGGMRACIRAGASGGLPYRSCTLYSTVLYLQYNHSRSRGA